jgi:hypothetical protein
MESSKISPSEITPENVYLNRRNFIRAGLLAGTAVATGLGYRNFRPQGADQVAVDPNKELTTLPSQIQPAAENLTPFD